MHCVQGNREMNPREGGREGITATLPPPVNVMASQHFLIRKKGFGLALFMTLVFGVAMGSYYNIILCNTVLKRQKFRG